MEREELIKALPQMAPMPGSSFCDGCGYEHNCSIHGCAVIRAAMEEILQLSAEHEAMRAKLSPADAAACRRPMSSAERDAMLEWPPGRMPNPPLTLEELREMDGEPVWVVPVSALNTFEPCWMLVHAARDILRDANTEWLSFDGNGKTWMAYRRKQEGTT